MLMPGVQTIFFNHVIFCLYVRASDHFLIKVNLVGFGLLHMKNEFTTFDSFYAEQKYDRYFQILMKGSIIHLAVIHRHNINEIFREHLKSIQVDHINCIRSHFLANSNLLQ